VPAELALLADACTTVRIFGGGSSITADNIHRAAERLRGLRRLVSLVVNLPLRDYNHWNALLSLVCTAWANMLWLVEMCRARVA
jgi:hypothetical protein